MAGFYGARLLIIALGTCLALAGLLGVAAGPAYASSGVWAFVVGIAIVVGSLVERARYRSEEADRTGAGPGPGGGEPAGQPMDPRFRPTEERFEDPTTRRWMRVWTDPTNGERRYVADD